MGLAVELRLDWKRGAACCAVVIVLTGCAGPGPAPRSPDPPFTFGEGRGSGGGNWISAATGATRPGPQGQPCDIYVWDRPIAGGRALRLMSASCPVPGRPGVHTLHDDGRMVIPLADSLIPRQPPPEPPPADPVARTAPVVRVEAAPLT